MSFELARKIADAVLYEGYVLYPYRASAKKNRVRWQFGVVVPRGYSERGGSEPWAMQTECLVEPGAAPTVDLRVRFLQVQARTVEAAAEGGFRAVESLEIDGRELVTWEEGVERQLDEAAIPLYALAGAGRTFSLEVPGGREVEEVRGMDGAVRGRVTRERWPLCARVGVAVEPRDGLVKLQVRIENLGPDVEGDRSVALRRSLVGAHTLLAVHDGAFVSLLDPPPAAKAAAESCINRHTWPVLVGPEGRRDVMLSSPIILYDHPAVAPESPGELCDATEIDEILLLRVMTLTEDEKREACATDERARRIIERSESLPPEVFERLHGAFRSLSPSPASRDEGRWRDFFNPESEAPAEEASVQVGARQVSRGTLVRITPRRRADSMDVFLRGRVARVARVLRDVEDQAYVGVTLEDDPAGEQPDGYGRFFYFYPEEIEPLGEGGAEPSPPEGGN